jgi:hypothetical protein
MAYVRCGDPVGDWFEAALPGRNAFCMRDVAHQSTGAQVLGLRAEMKNMLLRFAENIAESRDWCSYWEITGDNLPAPVDYTNDQDFWYNLPANFDILECCWRQYLWTGDRDYIEHPSFLNFYERTLSDYVQAWDIDKDGLIESQPHYGRRGIGSYEEATSGIRAGGDLVAAQAAAYEAYANIQQIRQNNAAADQLRAKAQALRYRYQVEWWSSDHNTFCSILQHDGSLSDKINFGINTSALYFGLIHGKTKVALVLDNLESLFEEANVESKSYFPEAVYRYGRHQTAYDSLCHLMDPTLNRREYPEVSYSVIGAIVTGLMGISSDARHNQITTLGRLTTNTNWIEVDGLPTFSNRIAVKHVGTSQTSVSNRSGSDFTWKACFAGNIGGFTVNELQVPATVEETPDGQIISWVTCLVAPNSKVTVAID